MAYSAPWTTAAKATYSLEHPPDGNCKGNLLTAACFTPNVPDAQNKSMKKWKLDENTRYDPALVHFNKKC